MIDGSETGINLNRFLAYLNQLSSLLPMLLGVFYWPKSRVATRLFTLFLIYGFLMSMVSKMLSDKGINNMFLFNLDTLIAYIALTSLFSL